MNNLVSQLATFHATASHVSLRNSCVCAFLFVGLILMAAGFYHLVTAPEESWFKFWMREIPTDAKDR